MKEITLYGTIGYDDLYGPTFVSELSHLAQLDNQITIKIDSIGGNVFDALSIYNCIKSLQAKGVTITAMIEVLCASAATFIACACDKVIMNSYGIFMIHSAGYYVQSASDQALLDKVNGILVEFYVAKTGKTVDEVKAMMAQDTYMTAQEAKAAGFVDQVIDEQPEARNVAKVDQLKAINNHKKYELVAQLYVPKNNNSVNMLEKVKAALNLESTANEDNIIASINGFADRSKKLTAEVERLGLVVDEQKKTIQAYEDAAKAEIEKRAIELINDAVKVGKVSASTKDKWLDFAKSDYEGTKQILADLKTAQVKLHAMVSPVVEGSDSEPTITLSPLELAKREIRERGNKKYSNE